MFPDPVSFLGGEIKTELGMKSKKDEGEYDGKFFSFKVPMDHEDNGSKTYFVKVKKYDTGTREESLRWRLVLNVQMKNHGYSGNHDMVMDLSQAMFAGRSLEAFLNERQAQEKEKWARLRSKQSTLCSKYMIVQFLNWQSMLLTSKVNGEMSMRVSVNI
jgi:hypothetical protein